MAFARILFKILLGLFVISLLIGVLLPDNAQVERQTIIKAPADKIFPYVNNLQTFHTWSPWRSLDHDTQYDFSGPEHGVGAKMTWQSAQAEAGAGVMQITHSELNRQVTATLNFGGKNTSTTTFGLEPLNDKKTQITWRFNTEFGWDLYGRYIGLLLDSMIGANYETGLAELKSRLEGSE